jgi:HTH-type transcriptional regulator/antitoxin HigA
MKKSAMQIHPIRSERDYAQAVARIGQLIGAAPQTPEGEELDVLATLVDAYEAKHYTMDVPDPVVAIRFRMEQQGLTRKDLEPLIGSRARVSEILNGKRNLTLEMVRRLKFGLGIPADSLIGPAKGTLNSAPAVHQKRAMRTFPKSRTAAALAGQEGSRILSDPLWRYPNA